MYLFNGLIENGIYLLFPILVYLIYVAYIRNLDKDEKNIFLELALYSSLFLMIRYGHNGDNSLYSMAFFNIPLLIAYLKKKNITAIILSIILIFFYNRVMSINIYILVFEYILYFINYNFINKSFDSKNTIDYIINNFVAIKFLILAIELFLFINPTNNFISNIFFLMFVMMIFTLYSYIILYFIMKCEEVVDLNVTIQQLSKEKKLHESMFKITHEVKNPLAVCKGYLQMFDYKNDDKIKRYVPIINSEIDRSLMILNDFSDFGKIKINKEDTDLELLIEEVCSCLEPLFRENEVITNFRFNEEEIYMDLDYNRIKQVFVNIFKNSIEAKSEKRILKISLNVKIYKNSVNVIISDNGVGMNDDDLRRVDEMFYTTKDNGTGLGVALSKEIMELHGGSIKYSSTLDKGTTVTLSFPYK